MKQRRQLLVLSFLALLLSSCDVEFSPNAEWREIPVVYCLLDQDDDTSYVRVQRCFMGNENQLRYASIPDSNFYDSEALQVFVEEWSCKQTANGVSYRTGSAPKRVFQFAYKLLYDKDSGQFYSAAQPVYACATSGMLDTASLYRLCVVKNNAAHDTLITSETRLIAGEMKLLRPNNLNKFKFTGTSSNKSCEFVWSSIRQARQYQPIVRFHYRDFVIDQTVYPWDTVITPHFIDIVGPTVKSSMTAPSLTTHMDENYYFSSIQKALAGDNCNKNYLDTVEIFVTCCSEALAAYLYAGNPAGVINQDPFTYTNIDGGLGIFGSRRTHICFKVATPNSSVDPYVKALKALGVGF